MCEIAGLLSQLTSLCHEILANLTVKRLISYVALCCQEVGLYICSNAGCRKAEDEKTSALPAASFDPLNSSASGSAKQGDQPLCNGVTINICRVFWKRKVSQKDTLLGFACVSGVCDFSY